MNKIAVRALRWATGLVPAAFHIDTRERWRAVLGAALGILVTGLLSRWAGSVVPLGAWLAAPLGASAVLAFALPASPLAQPWAVIGGSTVSAAIGMACAWAIQDVAVAAALAVALAIGAMFLFRCLHPPGGAMAMLAVLSHASGAAFSLPAVLLNAVVLVLAATVYNTLTGRRYPHVQARSPNAALPDRSRFSTIDLDAALAHYNQVLDVSRDDLEELLHHAEAAAYRRNLGDLRCADIMSRDPVAVSHDTRIPDAWALMRRRRIKALPVVDRSRHIVGIVSLSDFVRVMSGEAGDAVPARLAASAAPTGLIDPPANRRVGEIMTRTVRVASAQVHVIELLPLFSEGGHHHLPIVDDKLSLVGILTQSDLVRALHRAVRPD